MDTRDIGARVPRDLPTATVLKGALEGIQVTRLDCLDKGTPSLATALELPHPEVQVQDLHTQLQKVQDQDHRIILKDPDPVIAPKDTDLLTAQTATDRRIRRVT